MQDRIAVTEFASELNTNRNAGKIFDHVLQGNADVISAAACDDIDLADIADVLFCQRDSLEVDLVILDNGVDRIQNRPGLLVDLFHHEMLKTALLGSFRIPLDLDKFLGDLFLIQVIESSSTCAQSSDFIVADIINISGIAQNGRYIRSQVGLTLTYTDDHGAVLTGNKDLSGIILKHESQRIRAAYTDHGADDGVHGSHIVLFEVIIDGLDRDFRISLGVEAVAIADQLITQFLIVFNNAVVDTDNRAVICAVGVGVILGGFAVGCPAGVSDAAAADHRLAVVGLLRQDLETSFCLDDLRIRTPVTNCQTG